jgi:perosamine synthetase
VHRAVDAAAERIPISGPSITDREIAYVTEAVSTAWYANHNAFHARFEAAFADYVGRRFAIATPSCTAALHLTLAALGIGPGDEVAVPDITWIASSAPISYVGATPLFVDVDEESWCMDAASLQRAITPRTKALIVVDLYGNMPDMDAIRAVADDRGIAVIEDAAEAIGSEYHGAKAGSFGVASTFSFHGSKTLTTGEGGMLVTDDPRLHERILFLRDHGRPAGDRMFWNTEVAFKYKMSSMQAALGLAQLERVEELVARKREIAGWYRHELDGLDGVTFNSEAAGVKNTYWMNTVIVDAIDKLALNEYMAERGVDCRPFFHPLSSLPAYASHRDANTGRTPVSYRLSPHGLNLPSALNLTQAQVRRVCATLREALADLAEA